MPRPLYAAVQRGGWNLKCCDRLLVSHCEDELPKYLPWADADMGSIERALKRYKTAGLEASFDIDRCDEGIVTISQADTSITDAPIVIFEIHKLERVDLPERTHWVVQIQSIDGKSQALKQHGCVAASALVFAIAKAEQELSDGLTGATTFDMAANSYWLK